MKRFLTCLLFVLAAVAARASYSVVWNDSSGVATVTWAETMGGTGYPVLFLKSVASTSAQWYEGSVISQHNTGGAGSGTWTFTPSPGQTYMLAECLQYSGAFTLTFYVKGTFPFTPPAGASTNKTISLTYHNASATEGVWVGVVRGSQPGLVFQNQYVQPGGNYSAKISVPATDTENYFVVLIDADKAFQDGGGSVSYYEKDGQNIYDFTGYLTTQGTGKNAATDGVAAGQASNVGQTIGAVTTGASESGGMEALNNPHYKTPNGATSVNAPTQGTTANMTNAITGALKDLKDAVQGGIEVTVTPTDMTATNAKLDTITNTLASANVKHDTTNTTLTATNVKLEDMKTKADTQITAANGTNGRLDSLNSAAVVTNGLISTGNGKLDSVVSATNAQGAKLDTIAAVGTAGNVKLDAVVSGMAANTTKLGEVKTSVDGLGAKLDTANGHLSNVAQIATGTHASQTAFENASKIAAAQSAAAGVAAYAGIKPTVGGPLSVSLPGSDSDWGPGYHIGASVFTFGFGRMSSQMDGLFVAGRSLLLAAMCIGFCKGASRTVTQYTVALPQVAAQDTGTGPENLVPGMSQTKTYATAAVSVVVIFAGAAAIVAMVDTLVTYYGGGIANIFAAMNFPAGSAAGAIDRFVPLAAGLGLTVLGVAVPYLVAPLFLGTAAILRFMKT